MKAIFCQALPFCAAALLAACGGTKDITATVPASHGEFDPSTGSWNPLSRVVTPPPPEQGAVIADPKGPGMMDKVGKTLKKPLQWVGLAEDEPPPVPAAASPATAVKKTAAPQ